MDMIFGARKTKVGGKPKVTKLGGFKRMAENLNKHTTTTNMQHLDAHKMQQRWD